MDKVFTRFAKENNSPLNLRNPIADNYLKCSRRSQRENVDIQAYHKLPDKEIGVTLKLRGDTQRFNLLKEMREEIEQEIGNDLVWDSPSQIYLRKSDSDPRDQSQWENQHQWLLEKLELFDQVFRPILRKLKTSENAQSSEPLDL